MITNNSHLEKLTQLIQHPLNKILLIGDLTPLAQNRPQHIHHPLVNLIILTNNLLKTNLTITIPHHYKKLSQMTYVLNQLLVVYNRVVK